MVRREGEAFVVAGVAACAARGDEQVAEVLDRDGPGLLGRVVGPERVRHDGDSLGWAQNPNGGDRERDWRGLVYLVRELAPGFSAEAWHWVCAENVRQR